MLAMRELQDGVLLVVPRDANAYTIVNRAVQLQHPRPPTVRSGVVLSSVDITV